MVIEAIIGYVIASILVQAPVLWLAGRMILGSKRAKFMDAVFITVSAVFVNAIIGLVLGQTVAGVVQLLVYLFLIIRYYETDWVGAAVVAVINTVLGWVIAWLLVILFGIASIF